MNQYNSINIAAWNLGLLINVFGRVSNNQILLAMQTSLQDFKAFSETAVSQVQHSCNLRYTYDISEVSDNLIHSLSRCLATWQPLFGYTGIQ